MFKKQITYTDYNGVERTETFYFNLTKAELTRLNLTSNGTFSDQVKKIVEAKDISLLCKLFEEIIKLSYGVKSSDGKMFIKNEEVFNGFYQSEAYSIFFMELAQNDEAAAKFINGLLPSDLVEKVNNETYGNQTMSLS